MGRTASTWARASRSCSSFAVVLVFASVARAQDEPLAARAIGFASARGITGMRDLVDARVPPDDVNIRLALRYSYDHIDVESRRAERTTDRQYSELVSGASFLGVIDAGLRLRPFEYKVVEGHHE